MAEIDVLHSPEQDAAFVVAMEEALTVDQRPYAPLFPVVNMDEQPVQLVSHARVPPPMRPGDTAKADYEYVWEETCNAFLSVQPLGGWREVHISPTKTAIDWTRYVKWIVDHPRFADAQRITLVCDNLNTHVVGSLYAGSPAEQAYRLMGRLELVRTPKHGSWLNMTEPELSVMTRQCFSERVSSPAEAARRVRAGFDDCNTHPIRHRPAVLHLRRTNQTHAALPANSAAMNY